MIEPWAAVVPIMAVSGMFSITSLVKFAKVPAGHSTETMWGFLGLFSFMVGFFTLIITGIATS